MAFTNITLQKRASDLVVAHLDHNFSNDDANITPPAGGAILPFGAVVFRAKGQNKEAAWARLTSAASLVTTNEFAVPFGDGYGFKADFVPNAIVAGRYNAVVVKRDAGLKEYYIKQANASVGPVPGTGTTAGTFAAANATLVVNGVNVAVLAGDNLAAVVEKINDVSATSKVTAAVSTGQIAFSSATGNHAITGLTTLGFSANVTLTGYSAGSFSLLKSLMADQGLIVLDDDSDLTI